MYIVNLFNRSFETAAPTSIQLRPLRFSKMATGGFEYAEIEINGTEIELWEALRWLRYYVIIYNHNQSPVWCGIIAEATINLGGITIGKTLDSMTNKIAVAYTYNDANGLAVRATTDYANNTETQTRYGTIERLESQGDMEETEAESLRDRALEIYGQPVSLVNVVSGNAGGSLRCRGLWSHLNWKLYNQPGGVARYEDTGNYEHLLGYGFSGANVGFDEWEDGLHDMSRRLEPLREDDYIVVSGATNGGNNGTFKVLRRSGTDAPGVITTYTASSIRFEASDDILDSASGLGFVESYELLQVSGSAVGGNNRYYFSKDEIAADHITVNPGTVSPSVAGPSITVAQGHSVQLDTALVTEYPSATITVTSLGSIVAQSFTLTADVPFTLSEVYIRVKRVGSPVDSLSVAVRTDVSGSPNTTSIESVTTLGSTIGETTTWLKVTFSNSNTLSYGSTYWLLTARTGSNDPDNYYVVELNEDAGYASGAVKLWNGSAWVARAVAADMPFQIWSWRQTTDQISDMLANANQFFTDYEIRDASGIYKRQFRDQDQTAQVEIENLLRVGTSADKRLLASVTTERIAQIYAEPIADSGADTMLNPQGKFTDITGQEIEPGKMPVGQWIQLTGVPVNVDENEKLSPLFLERAEWDCEQERFSALEFKGADNPWEIARFL